MDAFVVRANGPLSGTVRVCGATKNAGLKQMAAALLAPGVTVLRNLHPVLDLDAMLDVMRAIGASAEWTGENEFTIDATDPLTPEAPYELVTRMRASINVLGPLLARCREARVAMPGGDNIGSRKLDMHFRGLEAMGAELEVVHGFIEARCEVLCGAAGGEVTGEGTRTEPLEMVVLKLGEMGLRVSPTPDGISARCDERLQAVDVATLPYPGFATDFMPLVVALLATAEGSAIVTENVFDNRFGFVDELHRMGADIRNEGRHAVVRGVDRLSGAPVRAQDVRAGAALVVAGLAADGETRVLDPYHVDRGYPDLAGQLQALGADVRRVRPTA